MNRIKDLYGDIMEELEGAKNYAWKALKHKHTSPDDASTYASMAEAELGHAEKLRNMARAEVHRLMREGDAEHPILSAMMDWAEEVLNHGKAEVHRVLAMYRET